MTEIGICVYIQKDEIEAIKDASDFLDCVADDRGNAYIDYKRQDQVVNILDLLLDRLKNK